METTIKEQLVELADDRYRQFASSLLPGIHHVLGVRLPELRKLARSIVKGDWRAYLEQAGNDFFEETMLQGMVIGYVKADIDEILSHTARFVPKIDNWSVCDSFCSGLKIARRHPERVWEFLQPYLRSDREFDIRFGVVMLLNYYVDERYIHRVLKLLDSVKREAYYVQMAVAWAVSICYIKLPEPTGAYLLNHSLDRFTYNKALQKITESHRIDPETKRWIRSLRQD